MLFAQPGQYLRIALAEGVEIVTEGRQDNDVAILQAAVHREHHIAEAGGRFAVGADQACLESGGQALSQLLAVTQAGEVKEILGMHQGRRENPIDGQNADTPQRRGELIRHRHILIILIGEIGQLTAGSSYVFSCVSRGCCFCSRGLARDGIHGVSLKHRVACIASKPAPARGRWVKVPGLAGPCGWRRYRPAPHPTVSGRSWRYCFRVAPWSWHQ